MTKIQEALRSRLEGEFGEIFDKIGGGEVLFEDPDGRSVDVWLHPEAVLAGRKWSLCVEIEVVDGVPVPGTCEFFTQRVGEEAVEAIAELPHVARPAIPAGLKAMAAELEARLELLDLPRIAVESRSDAMFDLLRRVALAHAAGDGEGLDSVVAEATEFLGRHDRSLAAELDAARGAPVFQ